MPHLIKQSPALLGMSVPLALLKYRRFCVEKVPKFFLFPPLTFFSRLCKNAEFLALIFLFPRCHLFVLYPFLDQSLSLPFDTLLMISSVPVKLLSLFSFRRKLSSKEILQQLVFGFGLGPRQFRFSFSIPPKVF